MPLVPINVIGAAGADFFTLSWQRPLDATIIGYQISYGSASGVYTTVLDVGNVTSYTISPLHYDQSTYAVVQSFDGAVPPNVSAYSPEVVRLFPITPPVGMIAVPDSLSPIGGVNDLYWVNPIDPNLKGQRILRSSGASSVSAAAPGTATVSGQTLTLDINGDGAQTISLATSGTGAAVAADIQAKVRALTPAYAGFTALYEANKYRLLVPSRFAGSSIVVSGGTAAPILLLGVANGGVETVSSVYVSFTASAITSILAPQSSYQDVVTQNYEHWTYAIQSFDFSNPPQFSSLVLASVISEPLLGSSPPSAPKNLTGIDNGISILLTWDQNPEYNVASYEVHWATTQANLISSPNIINVGPVTSYVLAGFLPTDDVFVQVFAIDNGLNPDGSSRAPYTSPASNMFSRVVSEGGITTAFVLQTDQSNNTTLVWNNIPTADHFEIQIDVVPTFDSGNLVVMARYIKVEDLVFLSMPYSFPPQRSNQVDWFWRVRPVYPGNVIGLWNTQVRANVALNGVLHINLGSNIPNFPPGAIFLPGVSVTLGATTYIEGVDFVFISPNQIARTLTSSIVDGETVTVIAEFEQSLSVGVNRRSQTRDRLHNFLDPLFYDLGAKTTNIFKWFQAISRGALSDYVIANRVLIQGNDISTTVPSELYERYGGVVTLANNEIPLPDAYAAIKALYPAFLNAGTVQAIELACLGLTGRECTIKQAGTGAGSGWILHGDDGPPSGQPDFVFDDFPGSPLPVNTYNMVLADFDDVFNWNIMVNNSARGVEKSVVRDARVGQTDSVGVTDIVPGSLRILAEEDVGDDESLEGTFDDVVDPSRYTIDYTNGTITWVIGQEPVDGLVYTVICGVFIIDLIKRILNELLPAHVNPIYTFQVQNLAQTLGLLVWEDSFWDSAYWAA